MTLTTLHSPGMRVILAALVAICLAAGTRGETRVTLRLTASSTPASNDEVVTLPVSQTQFDQGETFYVELWASTIEDNGFASVYVDVAMNGAAVLIDGIASTDLFDLFASGTASNDRIDELGGSHLGPANCEDPVGVEPNWARIAVVEMHAEI
ncbi:MAG: hypothetical protein KJ749_07790, partial [Planctomycetes bacterium]|nr:hypothetical protein [Planctomycetota bacterium]